MSSARGEAGSLVGDLSEMGQALRQVVVATERYRVHEARQVLGIGVTELHTVGMLSAEGAATPGEIAARLQITSASATELIDRLERGGLVSRAPHPTDRRKLVITLTASGHDKIGAIQGSFSAALHRSCRSLTEGQQQVVLTFLREAATEIEALVGTE